MNKKTTTKNKMIQRMKNRSLTKLPAELISRRIYIIRGSKVMLDEDLARLYDVPTGRLNEQVSRNLARFPEDFMFQLNGDEIEELRSQIAISNGGRGGRRYRPRAFTEQGVAMLSSVLRSRQAVAINIAIMRVFVELREMIASHAGLARKVDELDQRIRLLFETVHELMTPKKQRRRLIGFQPRS